MAENMVHNDEQPAETHVLSPEPDIYDEIDPADLEPEPFRPADPRRVWTAIVILLLLLGLALGPPLINVSRYRREIAASISASLGRPVRLDSVSLNLLPMPSFTLENFVVAEDPAFGAEPILRANQVRATLRLNSLWRHKVEFSTITLEDPSVNLVHLPDGRWNLQAILLQASRVPAAPTVQKQASDAPRFPYIEASGARVNLKLGAVKMPLSLTDAHFALWLPDPNQWHLRLEGHPNRTDTAATDTGAFQLEGTLGRAATLEAIPVDLNASWTKAPLGGVSWVVLGRDLGLRGTLDVHMAMNGSVGANRVESHVELHQVRRADFVPTHPLDADIACAADALEDLHRLDHIACHWPPVPTDATAAGVSLTGTLPELLRPASLDAHATWQGIPAELLLQALTTASQRVSPDLTLAGVLSGEAACCASHPDANADLNSDSENDPASPFAFSITDARLALGSATPILNQSIAVGTAAGRVTTEPLLLALGGTTPAQLMADADWSGLHLHLSGSVQSARLLALAKALPQFGDGLNAILPTELTPPPTDAAPAPIHLDADATRQWFSPQNWFGPQTWTQAAPSKSETVHRKNKLKRNQDKMEYSRDKGQGRTSNRY